MDSSETGNILIVVDEHPENLLIIESVLQSLGQNIVKAGSGAEALNVLLHQDFILIILDVQISKQEEFEIDQIRKKYPKIQEIPIIFLLTFIPNQAQIFPKNLGGRIDYLFKPIVPEILKAKVSVFIELYQQKLQIQQQSESRLHQAEAAIIDSGMRLAAILDIANDAIITVNESRKITLFNKSAEKIFGYAALDIVSRSLETLFPERFAANYCEKIANLAQVISAFNEIKKPLEIFGLRQDGKEFPAEVSISQLELNNEQILIIILRDITERKQAEMAMFESEERFQAFMNHSPAAQWMIDTKGKLIYVNQTYLKTFQLPTNDVIGKTIFELFDIHLATVYFQSVNQAIVRNELVEVMEKFPRKDGQLANFLVYKFPIKDAFGNSFVGGIAIDITERELAKKALLESESRYQAAAEGSLDAFFLLQCFRDKSGQILDFVFIDANSQGEAMLSLPKDKIIGKKLCDLLPINRTDGFFEKYVRVVETQKVLQEEFCLNSSQIKANWIQHQVVPLPNGIAITSRNITAAKEAEFKLQQANEQLTNWVKELESHNQEIAMLGEMTDILQACITVEEAYEAISHLLPPLFPDISGGVFIISASKHLVEAVATWKLETFDSEVIFTPNECWGLRRGRTHLFSASHHNLRCKHTHEDSINTEFLCIPLMAQGETLGVLHLSSSLPGKLNAAKEQLAATVAEHIAIGLANLKLRETLENQSIRDPLTGLFNRRYLEESLERELRRAERGESTVGIIMLDVDHFKQFNDTFGHEAGDTVLRELGLFLKRNIRASDIACRYGGEEFILILPDASLEDTQNRAEILREGVKYLKLQNRRKILGSISISLGVSLFPDHGLSREVVIEAADRALYQAKHEGRDLVRVYPQALLTQAFFTN